MHEEANTTHYPVGSEVRRVVHVQRTDKGDHSRPDVEVNVDVHRLTVVVATEEGYRANAD